MRHLRTVALTVVLLVGACGGGSDADDNEADRSGGDSGGTTTTAESDSDSRTGSDPNLMSANFDLADLPDGFPAELVPPSWTAGQATDILGPYSVNFESDMEFEEVVAYYDGIFGPSNPIVGDPGEQLAQWTADPTWVASVFDGDPLLIGFVDITE